MCVTVISCYNYNRTGTNHFSNFKSQILFTRSRIPEILPLLQLHFNFPRALRRLGTIPTTLAIKRLLTLTGLVEVRLLN